jgi:hypothetical protein
MTASAQIVRAATVPMRMHGRGRSLVERLGVSRGKDDEDNCEWGRMCASRTGNDGADAVDL